VLKPKLFAKLFLLLFVVMSLLLGAILLAVHLNFKQGLSAYWQTTEQEKITQFTAQLEAYYEQEQSFEAFYAPESWFRWVAQSALAKNPLAAFPTNPQAQPRRPHPPHRRPPPPRLIGELDKLLWLNIDRLYLLDNQGWKIIGPPGQFDPNKYPSLPIMANGQRVGWLVVKPAPADSEENPLLLDFVEQQLRGHFWIIGLALLVSVVLASLLARQILLPLRRITTGMHSLAAGNYGLQIAVEGHDELAALAQDFNHLGRALADSEQVRQQWLADIAHELRTPLAVLRLEMEALVDGVRSPTPERLQSLNQELGALTRLVDDLYQLSLSDLGALDYQFSPLNLVWHCAAAVEAFQNRFAVRAIGLHFIACSGQVMVNGDAQRLTQLLTNLLENSYRYTDEGGTCEVRLSRQGQQAKLTLSDSAPAVPPADLAFLFDRFYRVERSRQRQTGGAGLGLTICQNIVKAHNGDIKAALSSLDGLEISITLPILNP
jgi:two-component system sensor histidine kinase BaeS